MQILKIVAFLFLTFAFFASAQDEPRSISPDVWVDQLELPGKGNVYPSSKIMSDRQREQKHIKLLTINLNLNSIMYHPRWIRVRQPTFSFHRDFPSPRPLENFPNSYVFSI